MRHVGRILSGVLALVTIAAADAPAQGLVANAGPDQSGMFVGATVNLNGSASVGATSFSWSVSKRPSGSATVLVNPTSPTPSFVPDRGGAYTIKLTVSNGVSNLSDTVVVTTGNRPPVANAGADRTGQVGKSVTIDGTLSSDPDLNKLTYKWTLVSSPPGSVVPLNNTTKSKASLLLDRPGQYVVQLVVKDGLVFSAPDQAIITTINTAPLANAGPDRQVAVGGVVQLNGTGSSDIDGNLLTYQWTLKRPSGSTAVLDNPSSPMPSFVPNLAGSYTATLTVNDGTRTAKDSVIVTTTTNRNPIARTKVDDRTLQVGQLIQLDASDSTDTNGGLLTYAWTITKKPSGSAATLIGPSTPRPTFTADRAGSYTFTLLTTDAGALTATDTQVFGPPLPQARAGSDQFVTLGTEVTLDGSASLHLAGALAYNWALISRPAGSMAELDDPSDPQPRFIPDLAGTYIAQLVLFDGARLSGADTVTITTNGNLPPQVDLGPDRRVTAGGLVTIDALATDPDLDPLAFSWALLSRPSGSGAALSGATGTPVHLTPDVAGDYLVQLTATDVNGLAAVDTLVVTTGNTTPVATGLPDAVVPADVAVPLSVAASDPDGGAITYLWSFLTMPAGSAAAISSPAAAAPSFTPDLDGVYVVQVVVRDSARLFAAAAVVYRVGAGGTPPVADAGDAQTVAPNTVVQLDGTGSSDPGNQPLTFAWQIISKPAGSGASLNNPAASQPTFTADLPGQYVVRLIVNNGSQDSAPSEVTVTANGPPTANAGPDQNGVDLLVAVQLTGAASTDPESQPLTYAWSFVSKPAGSAATLSSPTSVSPAFTPDLSGIYVVQLVADDDTSSSAPDTVTITSRRLLSLSPSSLTLSSGASAQVTVTAAYATGTPLVVQLTSSNTGVATVPVNVTIPANQLSATFNVTGGATNGGALVTAAGGAGAGAAETVVAVGARLAQWNVDASGAWDLPSNWTGNAIPGAGDVVVIDRPAGNFVVTISQPTTAIASLLVRESLNIFSTLTLNGAGAFDGGVSLSATLGGSGSAALNGPFTWTGDTVSLAGGLTVLSGQTLTFPSNGSNRALIGSSLINHGTLAMGTGNLVTMQTAATITNASDGLWTVGGSSSIGSNGAGAYAIVNAGTLRKTGPGNLTLGGFNTAYVNTGTIDLQGGAVLIEDSTLTSSGLLAVASGATFHLNRVTLAAGTTFSGSGLLNMNGATVTANLTITLPMTLSGTLTGSGTVNVGAPFTWIGETVSLAGGLNVLSGQTLTFPSNGSNRALVGSSLTNHGTVAMGDTNTLTLQAPASVTNAADGLWTVTNGTITSNGSGALSFSNAGILRKTGTGQLALAGFVAWTNTGTFDLQAGTTLLQDAATVANSGLVSLGANTVLYAHNFTFTGTSTFAGTGTLVMNGATTATGTVTITVPTQLTQTLTGTGTVKMAAPFSWVSGNITSGGGLEVLAGQTLTLPNNNTSRALVGSTLLNHGTVTMGDTNGLVLQAPASVTNAADGLWTVVNGTITSNGSGALSFSNAGILRKTGTGQLALAGFVAWTNTGAFDLQAGTTLLADAATVLSSGLVSLGSNVILYAHNVTFTGTSTFAGTGTLVMNGATTATGTVTITVPTQLTQTLTGTGTVKMAAPFSWVSGNITSGGGLEVLAGQTLTLPNNNTSRALVGSTLLNHGTVTMGDTNGLVLQAPASVTNAADGLWTVVNGTITSNGSGALSFSNAGTLRKTGTGQLALAGFVAWTNTGTFDLQAGTTLLQDAATVANSGPVSLGATADYYVHNVTFNGGSAVSGAGQLIMNGLTTLNTTLTVPTRVALSQTLTGTGTLRMAGAMTWTSGSLSLAGGLENLAGQTLSLGGTVALFTGTSFRNFGTVAWANGGSLIYQGGSIAVRNEVGGVWTMPAGGFTISSNGGPAPANSFTFLNAGTMQGAGNPATTLNVHSFVSFSSTGTISNLLLNFVP